jgi:hypothetical protein
MLPREFITATVAFRLGNVGLYKQAQSDGDLKQLSSYKLNQRKKTHCVQDYYDYRLQADYKGVYGNLAFYVSPSSPVPKCKS